MTIEEQQTPEKLIIIVGGPAGTGKSTVAASLTSQLTNNPAVTRDEESITIFPVQFIEGDELHPAANIAKMSAGIPLTDEDRMPWLKLLAETVVALAPAPAPIPMPPTAALETNKPSAETLLDAGATDAQRSFRRQIVICTCSCLKRKYRDYLRANIIGTNVHLRFVFLHASPAELVARTMQRQGHFMKPEMVQSQIDAMEVPTGDELITSRGSGPGDTVAVGEDLQALGPLKLAQRLVNDPHIFPQLAHAATNNLDCTNNNDNNESI
jgi:gluconokinase